MYLPGIDAVVVNYRTPRDLEGFTQAWTLFAAEVPNSLYIVNVSPTLEDVQVALEGVGEAHLSFPANVGYSGACNAGALLGRREIIALFNADTRITRGVLASCRNVLLAKTERAIVGPRQVDDQNRFVHAGIFGTQTAPTHRSWMGTDTEQYCDVRDDATTVSGSAFFIRRSVWDELTNCEIYRQQHPEALGALLPTPHYYEETWAAYHARAHGYFCTYNGIVRMVHRYHQASPPGGHADKQMPKSREIFRSMCRAHGIVCE